MPCRVCRDCNLNLSNTSEHVCPVCGKETEYDRLGDPSPEFEVEVAQAKYVGSARRKLLLSRRRYFYRLGYRGAVLEVLVESPVDPHDTEDLLKGGCPPDVAVRILL